MLFMTDCVVLLSHHIAERVSLRELRVVKYRGSRYGEAEFPMVIGPQGVEVSSFGPAETRFKVSTERVSTGVARLDTMLDGGYFRGASVLISGAPGTAKSTLAAAFAQAACGRGEKALYVSFDESAGMIERDMSSVGIRLSPHVESGLLMLYSAHGSATSGEEHFIKLKALIREHQPRCLVIDPLSAIAKAGGRVTVESFAQQLFYLTRLEGITVVVTSLTTGNDSRLDDPAAQVSTSADTWIYVSFMAKQGERNRALTIVKSRGTKHSNQVRELILSDQGVTLTDVFTAGGEVLMGSLRWEKERAVELEGKRMHAEIEHKRRLLELGEAETVARMDVLKHELEARRGELALLKLQQEEQKEQTRIEPEDLGALRGADKDPT
jgi:circadian clock protein KaiC